MTEPVKAIVRDAVYIRTRHLDDDRKRQIRKRFARDFFGKEKVCEACDFYEDRVCDVCLECPNYVGKIKLYKIVNLDGKKYVRLPFGDRRGINKIFGKVKYIDRNKVIPIKPIKFIKDLHPYQKPVTPLLKIEEHGILRSPPRSGKTVMGAHLTTEVGCKTIIMASQKEWLDNFLETFIGSDTEQRFTNIKSRRIGFARRLADFEKFDVCLVTYQTFLKDTGQSLLKKVRNLFTLMIIDEVQRANAFQFSKVVGQFSCKYKIGLSGTPERKDRKEWVMEKLLGPIVCDVKVPRLVPRVEVVDVPLIKLPTTWTFMVNKLENNEKRLALIAKHAVRDMKKGHTILIPLARIKAIKKLVRLINNEWPGRDSPCGELHGQMKKQARKDAITLTRQGVFKCLVGNTTLISVGTNIARASMLYEVTPSSNLPNAAQRFSRILTPLEGKMPVIKYFLDDSNVRRSCMSNEYFQCLLPKFRPLMTPEVKQRIAVYLKSKTGKDKYRQKVGRYF